MTEPNKAPRQLMPKQIKREWMHDTIAYHPLAVALAKVMLSEMKVNGRALWEARVSLLNILKP